MTTERDAAFAWWQAQLEATPRDPPLAFDIVARRYRPAERPATPLMERTSPLKDSGASDLRSLDYVSDCDHNLLCPICQCPFIDPVPLLGCDHVFCRECVEYAWKVRVRLGAPSGSCPTCRRQTSLDAGVKVTKLLNNMLDELVVRCPLHTDGCKAEIRRNEVEDHLKRYCDHTKVQCSSTGCSGLVARKDLEKGCLHYPVSCGSCRECMMVWQLEVGRGVLLSGTEGSRLFHRTTAPNAVLGVTLSVTTAVLA
ncbi:hypothetical protein BJ546DRAFT_59344 [Cryomyces antarcticus]